MHKREKSRWKKLSKLSNLSLILPTSETMELAKFATEAPVPEREVEQAPESELPPQPEPEPVAPAPEEATSDEEEAPATPREAQPMAEEESEVGELPLVARESEVAHTVLAEERGRGSQLIEAYFTLAQEEAPTEQEEEPAPPPPSPRPVDLSRVKAGVFFSQIPFTPGQGGATRVESTAGRTPSLLSFRAGELFQMGIPWSGQGSDGPGLGQLLGMATRDAMSRAERLERKVGLEPSSAAEFFRNLNWQGEMHHAS